MSVRLLRSLRRSSSARILLVPVLSPLPEGPAPSGAGKELDATLPTRLSRSNDGNPNPLGNSIPAF